MKALQDNPQHSAERYAKAVLDSLSAHIAILDRNGVILETNLAWRNFANSNHIRMRPDMIDVNYLDICDAARGNSSERAGEVADGIRDVIAGRIEEFVIDYPCHSDSEQRWFYMRATRLAGAEPLRIVVSHENITALKETEQYLMQRERELDTKTRHLEEANIALKVLLNQREHDKRELEEQFCANLTRLVLPHLEHLKLTSLDTRQKAYVEIVESHVREMSSPFFHRTASLYLLLTPQEIQVAALIKDGRTSKDIAKILSIAVNTVDFHRKNIRKKLGLNGQKTNLRTYLLSLQK